MSAVREQGATRRVRTRDIAPMVPNTRGVPRGIARNDNAANDNARRLPATKVHPGRTAMPPRNLPRAKAAPFMVPPITRVPGSKGMIVPGIAGALAIGELLDTIVAVRRKQPLFQPPANKGWIECPRGFMVPPVGPIVGWAGSGSCDSVGLTGQYVTAAPLSTPTYPGQQGLFIVSSEDGNFWKFHQGWYRPWWAEPANSPGVVTQQTTMVATAPMPDPNVMRRSLSLPEPATRPVEVPSRSPITEPTPSEAPAQPPVRSYELSYDPYKARGENLSRRPSPRHRRKPEGPKSRRNKNLTKSQQIAVAIMGALDTVSELSEIVNAFYDALPPSVKQRYKQNKRGLIDSAGQYGIGGADWKLEALWHNWHRVNTEQAVENLINNAAQDKIHGLMHKNLPRNTGSALDGGMGAIEDMMSNHLYL